MGKTISSIIENVAFQGFEMGVVHLHGQEKKLDDKTIKEMFRKSVDRKRIPLLEMGKERLTSILLVGFCSAMEGSDIAFYTQCRILNEMAGLNYDETALNAFHMQAVRLNAWKNQLR